MIISRRYKYVYVGIPRTGSKSMNHWLMEHFEGVWHDGHHSYVVPDEFTEYCAFTLVRNPYDRVVSAHYAVHWDEHAPTEDEIEECGSQAERLRRMRALMQAKEHSRRNNDPIQSDVPLAKRIEQSLEKNKEGADMPQTRFIELANIALALYFEKLPECLEQLPFVDPASVPAFPHHPERGIRPDRDFFDVFQRTDMEEFVWATSKSDLELLGYRRYETSAPDRPCWQKEVV